MKFFSRIRDFFAARRAKANKRFRTTKILPKKGKNQELLNSIGWAGNWDEFIKAGRPYVHEPCKVYEPDYGRFRVPVANTPNHPYWVQSYMADGTLYPGVECIPESPNKAEKLPGSYAKKVDPK